VRSSQVRVTAFRGQHNPLAVVAALQPFADGFFAGAFRRTWNPVAVYEGGIDEVSAQPHKGIQQGKRIFLLDDCAKAVGPQAQPGWIKISVKDVDVFHWFRFNLD